MKNSGVCFMSAADLVASYRAKALGKFSASGNPAPSAPVGFTPDGLPIGLYIVGRQGQDDTVLRVAREPERESQ